MPAAESGRRDWPGPEGRRRAGVPLEMRAGVRPPVARSCLVRRAPNTAAWALLGCRPLCVVQAGPATEAGTFGVAGAKAVAGKGVSLGWPVLEGSVALVTGASGGSAQPVRPPSAPRARPWRWRRGAGTGWNGRRRHQGPGGTVLEYGITGERPAAGGTSKSPSPGPGQAPS